MRIPSAHSMKGRGRLQDEPRPGTKTREVYDLLLLNRGKPVSCPPYVSQILQSLRLFYGMDIVRKSKGRWMLVGEWLGSRYVDYRGTNVTQQNSHT